MRGDFSRFSFKPGKHYTRVLKQQGRVELDADWNEYAAIQAYLREIGLTDLIGKSGVPAPGAGFKLTPQPDGNDLLIGAGRMYVDGLLVENDANTSFSAQPYLSLEGITPPPRGGVTTNTKLRTDLLYLDVWEEHVTSLEDPDIREVALGGPDTATRLRTMWRARIQQGVSADDCDDAIANFPPTPTGTGQLTNSVTAVELPTDPCLIAPDGSGYRGLENRLYRVEIHQGGPRSAATFKWSDADAAVVYAVGTILDSHRIRLTQQGRDAYLKLSSVDSVEVISAEDELKGNRGLLTSVEATADLDITLTDALGAYMGRTDLRVRRWSEGARPVNQANIELGTSGIGLSFSNGEYRTGDFWTFPARTRTGMVEILNNALPHGTRHHYARLGLVEWWFRTTRALVWHPTGSLPGTFIPDLAQSYSVDAADRVWSFVLGSQTWAVPAVAAITAASGSIANFASVTAVGSILRLTLSQPNPNLLLQVSQIAIATTAPSVVPYVIDCRRIFPPLGDTPYLFYVGGDGQEVMPSPTSALTALPHRLEVGVSNWQWPVQGARVRFHITEGNGRLQGSGSSVVVVTGADGVASCAWELDSATQKQQVEASLLDAGGHAVQTPVRFSANLSVASQVAYDPNLKDCADLAGVFTVQDAIDKLCARPSGGGGGCEVTVGQGGQYDTLQKAVDALRSRGIDDMCICVLPGSHDTEGGLKVEGRKGENLRLKIVGCGPGSRLICDRPFDFRNVASVIIRDLDIRFTGIDRKATCMHFEATDQIEVAHCRIWGGEDQPMIEVADADRVLLEDNVIEPQQGRMTEKPLTVFDFPPLLDFIKSSFLDRRDFSRDARVVAAMLLGMSDADWAVLTKRALANLARLIRNQPRELTMSEQLAYQSFLAVLREGRPNVSEAFLADLLGVIRDETIKAQEGVALILADGMAETMLDNNNFLGAIHLYGRRTSKQLADLNKIKVVETLLSTGRSLHMRDNQVGRVFLSDTMVEQLSKPKGGAIGIYQAINVTNNSFAGTRGITREGEQLDGIATCFLGEFVTLTANGFTELNKGVWSGGVICRGATLSGNYSKNDNNPPGLIKILTVPRAANFIHAANLIEVSTW